MKAMRKLTTLRSVLFTASSVLALLGSQSATAQQTTSDGPAAAAPDAGTPPVQDGASTGEDIVVTGVRGAQQKAINVKRQSAQIVDSIAAEDIGKLPDVTIADSLQRVTGVQITRSAGQGASVNIRGLANVLTTLNGEQFLGASNITGAQPNLTDIPSTLFAGVDVVKSPTAADLTGGNSGIVALKTRRPFDLPKGVTATASVQDTYGSMTKDWSQNGSALVAYHGDRFGILVAGSYDHEILSNKNPRVTNGILKTTDAQAGFDVRGDGDVTNSTKLGDGDYFYNPVALEFDNSVTQRERIGGNASVQYDVTDSLQLVGDVAYTRLRNRNSGNSAVLHGNFSNDSYLPTSQIDSNGVVEVADMNLTRFQMHTLNQYDRSRSINTNLEARFKNDGPFSATLRYVHGDSRSNYDESDVDAWGTRGVLTPTGAPNNCAATAPVNCVYFNPGSISNVRANVDWRGDSPAVTFLTDVTNPANYSLTSTWSYGQTQKAMLDAYRGDAQLDTDWGPLKNIRIGGRYGTRDVSNDAYRYLSPAGAAGHLYYYKDPGIVDTVGYSVIPIRKFADVPNLVAYAGNFGPIQGIPNIPAISPGALDDVNAYNQLLFPGTKAYQDPQNSYRVRQRQISAYAEANFDGSVGSLEFTGNAGVRYVKTSLNIFSFPTGTGFIGDYAWNGVAIAEGINKAKNDSNDFLPDANLSLHLRDDMYLRFAYAKTLGQLDLGLFGRGLASSYAVNGTRTYQGQPLDRNLQRYSAGSAGNPNLELPRTANYNVSYEWYFNRSSLFSVAAFYFDVKSFLQTNTLIELQPDADGVVREGGPVTRPVNGEGGSLKGLEVGFQTIFDWLPGALSGFGGQLNYTYSDSGSSNVDLFGKTLPVPDNSKHQANAVLFYQKGPLQGRVAYNYRSKRFAGFVAAADDNLAVWNRATGYLDASASYDVTPKFTLFVQGSNLTKENEEQYAQFKNFWYGSSIFERRLTFGVRIRN
ncbi:TonB-dependent receptor [Sphingomonas sp. OK281]|nr:TonB-dependent receptor [Sphingomonas sp. OK281]